MRQWWFCLMAAWACANRALPPRLADTGPSQERLPRFVHLNSFKVYGLDVGARTVPLRNRFLWELHPYVHGLTYEGPPRADAVVIDVEIALEQTDYHTVVLDALSVYAFGLLTPWWGEVEGSLKLT